MELPSLKHAYRQARRSGALHLAARELTQFPLEVCRLEEQLDTNEKFWECVDLLKIDMSHNSIGHLPPEIQSLELLISFKFSQNQLTALPESFYELTALQVLDLSHNRLQEPLSHEIRRLQNLKVLNLSFNALTELPSSLCDLSTLEHLDVEHNHLSVLPDNFGQLKGLFKFNCASNQLESFPQSFRQCVQLNDLKASNNHLVSFEPDCFVYFQKLMVLDVRQNRIGHCPVFPQSSALAQVFLSFNQLSALPDDAFFPLQTCLVFLDLGNNQLKGLPRSISYLTKLKTCDVTNNNLSDLPYGLGYLKELDRLLIDGNPLRAIRRSIVSAGHHALKKYLRSRGSPLVDVLDSLEEDHDEFSAMKKQNAGIQADPGALESKCRNAQSTKTLELTNEQLRAFPALLPHQQRMCGENLTSLNLSHNHLCDIPNGIEDFPNLTSLHVSHNCIQRLSPRLLQLSQLRILNLQHNGITSDVMDIFLSNIHHSLNNLPPLCHALHELDLRQNKLSKLDSSLIYFTTLQTLLVSQNQFVTLEHFPWQDMSSHLLHVNVSDNQIHSLGNIAQVTSVQILNLENNNLTLIPPELALCSNLQTLLIAGNPQRAIRTHTIGKGTEAILEYLKMKLPMNNNHSSGNHRTNDELQDVVCDEQEALIEEQQEAEAESKEAGDRLKLNPEEKEVQPQSSKSPASSMNDSNTHATRPDMDTAVLDELAEKMHTLEFELDNPSLTQAKRYAIKKDLAKVRSVHIREKRRISKNTSV